MKSNYFNLLFKIELFYFKNFRFLIKNIYLQNEYGMFLNSRKKKTCSEINQDQEEETSSISRIKKSFFC
jgi:hypothetical protein